MERSLNHREDSFESISDELHLEASEAVKTDAGPRPPSLPLPGAVLGKPPPPARPSPSSRPTTPPEPRSSRRPVAIAAAAAIAVVVVLVLVAKGQVRTTSSSSEPPSARAGPAAAAPGAPAAERSRRGISDGEILFGMSSPFTGAIKELGRGMKVGIELAFAATNEAGGVHGRRLKLVALDDEYDPARTAAVMRELVEQRRVFGVVGNVGSLSASASVPYAVENKLLFLGALSGAPALRREPPERYVFNFRPSYAEETAAAVRYLVGVRRYAPSEIAVFAQDDDFGAAGLAGVVQQMREYGVNPEGILKLSYKRNTAEVDGAVRQLLAATTPVRAVVMVATYQPAGRFIQRASDSGVARTFTNVSGVGAEELADELGQAGKRAMDVVVTQAVPSPRSQATAVMRYRSLMEKHQVGERPSFVSLEGYVVGNLLVEALRRAGKDVDTESLIQALEGVRELDLGIGAPITFGQRDHQGSHKVWGTMLEPSGTYRAIELD